jgi:hypothetical protein
LCYLVRCPACGQATWAGCGQHAGRVMNSVPADQRCTKEDVITLAQWLIVENTHCINYIHSAICGFVACLGLPPRRGMLAPCT